MCNWERKNEQMGTDVYLETMEAMTQPQPISLCTSTIENAGYVNRMSGVVRGRRLIPTSCSIMGKF